MQLSTTTGICCPELWRGKKGMQMESEDTVKHRGEGNVQMCNKNEAKTAKKQEEVEAEG